MTFDVGTQVVYPSHGIAEVIGREEHEVDGVTVGYLVLSIHQRGWGTSGDLRVSVPESRAEGIGVRSAVSSQEALDILEVLAVTELRLPSNWSRRLKNHQEKLKSGDVYQCAEVVRNLAYRMRTSTLSTVERTMYADARHRLIGELAVSWGIAPDAAEERVDAALHPASTPELELS
jgi:CarD family transcriptional regulator